MEVALILLLVIMLGGVTYINIDKNTNYYEYEILSYKIDL